MEKYQDHIHVIVTAHPDDESMFFVPTILSLKHQGYRVWLICMTNGNYDGLGKVREKELELCCRDVLQIDEMTLLTEMQDHPTQSWDIKRASSCIEQVIKKQLGKQSCAVKKISLLTFDSYGVSGHINHQDTYLAVRNLYIGQQSARKGRTTKLPPLDMFTLESVYNPISKFIPLWEWFLLICCIIGIAPAVSCTVMADQTLHRSSQPLINWKAMASHYSQFVWYRRLFVIFSCYTYRNRLRAVMLHDEK